MQCRAKQGDNESDDTHDDLEAAEEQRRRDKQLKDFALYSHTAPTPIGGEYGQGFVNMTSRGSSVRMDVDDLNETMAAKGRVRLRHAMKPDESYGILFSWEGVICNTKQMQQRAWRRVALSIGRELPEFEQPQMYALHPERAILDVLRWTADPDAARNMACEVASAYAAEFSSTTRPADGLMEWLNALQTSRVPCAVVSKMGRLSMLDALQRMGLQNRFSAIVSAEDGMETTSQAYLSAAIKLGRPPNRCVAFVSDPGCIAAAHNCSMKAVAVVGVHPQYSLQTADLTCRRMSELTVYNVRRLFANVGAEFMDLRKMNATDTPPDRWQKKRTTTLAD